MMDHAIHDVSKTVGPQAALIYAMVTTSAADRDISDTELRMMTDIVRTLPIFKGFSADALAGVAQTCGEILATDEGLETILEIINGALPQKLRETAYALAVDIVACDGDVHQEELRMLEILRHGLEVDRLVAAAIERGARARFAHL